MPRVVVVGSVNVDLVVTADRFPRPGETIVGASFARHPGGKGANQAIAAARMGARTLMIGAVGADPLGMFMRETLAAAGVDVGLVAIVEEASTGVAQITVAGGENSIVVVAGANALLSPTEARRAIAADDIVLAQFETPCAVTRAAFEAARAVGAMTILNAAPASGDLEAIEVLASADLVVVNEIELQTFCRRPLNADSPAADIAGAMRALRSNPRQIVVTTLGARGLVALDDRTMVELRGHCVPVLDTTGAGDCFVGALAAGLSVPMSLEAALAQANAAAALAVQRPGAGSAMPRSDEVGAFMAAKPA